MDQRGHAPVGSVCGIENLPEKGCCFKESLECQI
jgi:hypothetical protein